MSNQHPSKPFVKGDPRIWRKGRPKSFDTLRPVMIDGHIATAAELILREWAMSKEQKKQAAFIEYAYGKVPTNVNLSGQVDSKVILNWDENVDPD